MKIKKIFLLLIAILVTGVFSSCVTTNVYEKKTQQLYQNDTLFGEEKAVVQVKDDASGNKHQNQLEQTSKFVSTAKMNNYRVEGEKETSTKFSNEKTTVKIYNKKELLATRTFETNNGTIIKDLSDIKDKAAALERNYLDSIDYQDFVLIETYVDTGFLIAKKEVTQKEYREVTGTNPSKFVGDDRPVESISIYEALDYCNKKSQREGFVPVYTVNGTTWTMNEKANGYRLPTYSEWNEAAKGGKFTEGQAYSGSKNLKEVGWYSKNSDGFTHDVAQKKPNVLGLYDMSGNVAEWCWSESSEELCCGGSFMDRKNSCTVSSAYRYANSKKSPEIGFRVVRNLTKREEKTFQEKQGLLENLDMMFYDAYNALTESPDANIEETSLKNIATLEQSIVESKANGGYIMYSFFGKPFVILGCSVWNLIKSLGYGFINFGGGFSTVTGNGFFWKMPDTKTAKIKARELRAENNIKYPEYHKPFTDNKITVNKIVGEKEQMLVDFNPDELKITSKETMQINNKLSVELSAKSDAYATASVVGWIGTILTVPISAVTWVFGAAAGVFANIAN